MRLFIIVLVLAAAGVARADEPEPPVVRVEARQSGQTAALPQVKLGEPFHVVVTVTARPDIVVSLPASLELDPFEAIDQREHTGTVAGEHTFGVTVVAWKPGKQTLPPIKVSWVAGGEVRVVASPSLEVEVVPVVESVDKAELRGTVGPVSVRERDWRLVIGAVIVASAGILVTAIALFLRRRRKRADSLADAAPVDTRPPHEIALARLRALAASPLADELDRRPFYFALAEIVRDFLGKRHGFDALELTTSELMAALDAKAPGVRADVEPWVNDCDMVKFARVPATREDALAALDAGVAVVEKLIPPPPPAVVPVEAARAT